MAENEVKKAKLNISIWFILFIIYLIVSLAFILKQNTIIETLNAEVARITSESEKNLALSNTQTDIIIGKLDAIVREYKASKEQEEEPPVNTPSIDVSMGIYNGSSDAMQMALTLSENNVASLTITNESGDSIINGTYSVAEGNVVFTSDDGMTTYNFTAVEDGSLKLVIDGVELTLLRK